MGLKRICNLEAEEAQYLYCAVGEAAIVFIVLFGITTVAHIIQAVVYRSKWCWVIIMGAAWECLGFGMRFYSTLNQTESSTASAGQLLILLAPLWINAGVYMIFGRMIWYYLPEQKIGGIKAISLGKMFIWLDICAFLVQATGGIMDAGFTEELDRIGLRIYMGGIALQQVFIIYFSVLLFKFYRRAKAGYTDPTKNVGWVYLTPMIIAVISLISLRVIYRLIEFSLDGRSKLSLSEAPFYILEATPMFLALALINVYHPCRFLVGPDAEFPKKPSRKERSNAKKAEKREIKAEKAAAKAEKKAARRY